MDKKCVMCKPPKKNQNKEFYLCEEHIKSFINGVNAIGKLLNDWAEDVTKKMSKLGKQLEAMNQPEDKFPMRTLAIKTHEDLTQHRVSPSIGGDFKCENCPWPDSKNECPLKREVCKKDGCDGLCEEETLPRNSNMKEETIGEYFDGDTVGKSWTWEDKANE